MKAGRRKLLRPARKLVTITQLAKLGATQHIRVIPDYDGKGNVTVTILFKPKDPDCCASGCTTGAKPKMRVRAAPR